MLRNRIALYRRCLSAGVDADVARSYLNEIVKAEIALRELDNYEKMRSRPDG